MTRTVTEPAPPSSGVYFDDFKVTVTPKAVVQRNEYYPFGLQHNTSWTRDNGVNNFLYNEGSELNTTTAMYDLPYRNYDAALGRFFQIDPLAFNDHSTSPFAYGGNNPVLFNDPWGLVVSVEGYSDIQIRSMYRADRADGYSGSFADWAQDNLDFGGPQGSGRTVVGTDGRTYGVNKDGQMGYWQDDDRQTSSVENGEFVVDGKRSVFVAFSNGSEDNGWGFWDRIGKGFGQFGQSFVDMKNDVVNRIPKTPVIYLFGKEGVVNERKDSFRSSGTKSLWFDWGTASDLLEMLGLGLGQSKYSKETVRDATIGPEKEGEALNDAFGETEYERAQPGDTIWLHRAYDGAKKGYVIKD